MRAAWTLKPFIVRLHSEVGSWGFSFFLTDKTLHQPGSLITHVPCVLCSWVEWLDDWMGARYNMSSK